MLALIEDTQALAASTKKMGKEQILIGRMLVNLRRDFYSDSHVNSTSDSKRNSIWTEPQRLYGDMYCDDEWSQLVKSLRIADDDVHHLRFVNTYVEKQLSAYLEEINDIRRLANYMADQLRALSRAEEEFNRAAHARLSVPHDEPKKETKKTVKFGNIPRKSKSAECSVHRLCSSCGLMQSERTTSGTQRKDLVRRRRGYGRYCSACGAVEVSSQNSLIRCHDCDGEIIIQGLCSSCDSLKGASRRKEKRRCERLLDKACSTCDVRRKKVGREEKDVKWAKGKGKSAKCASRERQSAAAVPKVANYVEDSSCCSDCGLTATVPECRRRCSTWNLSNDSLVPLSESDRCNMYVRSYSQDYDVSSSVSSSGTEKPAGKVLPAARASTSLDQQLSLLPEETQSVDEEFNTPREFLSVEDVSVPVSEVSSTASTSTFAVTACGAQLEESERSSDVEDFQEATEGLDDAFEDPVGDSEDFIPGSLLRSEDIEHPVLADIRERMERAEEAVDDMSVGNTKLEGDVFAMENVSQQNLKLSTILREIMLGIATHLDFIQSQAEGRRAAAARESREAESEGSDEFEEALEECAGRADSDADTFYDIPPPNYFYLCLECGIKTSYKPLGRCLSCGGTITVIPNDLLGEGPSARSDQLTAVYAPINRRVEALVQTAYPVFVKADLSRLPLTVLENRLRVIEKETKLLKDNNELINLLVESMQEKLKDDLRVAQREAPEKEESEGSGSSETTIVEFDVSFYQIRRLVTERNGVGEVTIEELGEDSRQTTKTFVEMKFEEVYKKEAQTVLELEVFEEKLAVEGLIIKEMEDFYTCSNTSQAVEYPEEAVLPAAVLRRFTSEKFQTARGDADSDELVISVEIEVEKEVQGRGKKAIRCEYKANLQRSGLKEQSCVQEREEAVPTVMLHPRWVTERPAVRVNAECVTPDNRRVTFTEVREYPTVRWDGDRPGEDGEDFVEIKPPEFFCGSSDEETENCGGDVTGRRRRKLHSIAAVRMPDVMYPVTEIALSETPFAVLNTLRRTPTFKREYARVSQVELGVSPASGVVLVQTHAVSSVELTEAPSTGDFHNGGSLEEFYEAQSGVCSPGGSDCSAESVHWDAVLLRRRVTSSFVHFEPVNLDGASVASIALPDDAIPVVVLENVRPVLIDLGRVPSPLALPPSDELDKALSLIREIESDVVEVKLHSAIEILPQLESILREHLQDKLKVLKKSSTVTESSLDVFLSTLNILSEEEATPQGSTTTTVFTDAASEERLGKMLQLLTGLEEAVRAAEGAECRQPSAGRISALLQALSTRVRDIGDEPRVEEVERTLQLTSELDVAVRDLGEDTAGVSSSDGEEGAVLAEQLRGAKRRIFEAVAGEAREREERVERDFERIERLEKENAESMRFLDTLLDKTLRRVNELDEIRDMVGCLREAVDDLSETMRTMERSRPPEREDRTVQTVRAVRIGRSPTLPRIAEVPSDNRTSSEEESVKGTLSSVIVALDALKSKAKEKKATYREIFGVGSGGGGVGRPLPVSDKPKAAPGADHAGAVHATITEFSRIGSETYYLSWSRPVVEGDDCVVVGYEIWVNGKVNQRVRNPERLRTILYSVHSAHASDKLKIKLFALTEDGRKRSLDDLRFPGDT